MQVSPATTIDCFSPEAVASASLVHLGGKIAEWLWKRTRRRFIRGLIQQFNQLAIVAELQRAMGSELTNPDWLASRLLTATISGLGLVERRCIGRFNSRCDGGGRVNSRRGGGGRLNSSRDGT